MVQCRRGHWRDALSSDNSTLAIKPDDAVALGNRGNVRHQLHPPHLSAAHHNSGEAADLIMWQARSVAMRVAKLPMSGVLRAQAIDRRDAGLHEGPRDRRGDGGDADSDAGGPAFYAAARCRSRPSDLCRGPRPAALASTAPRSAAGRGLPISASSPGLTGRSSNGRRSGHLMPAFLPSPERSSHHPCSDAANAPVERL